MPADIFAGTPVGAYANGADGIVVPAATATGPFSTATIAADLIVVKHVMIQTRLDPKVLTGHDSSAFLGMIASDERGEVQKDLQGGTIMPYLTEIGSSDSLTDDPIKVAGTMTYTERTSSRGVRELDVTTNYVFVYPFTGPRTKPGDHLVVLHQNTVWEFPNSSDVLSSSRGLWIHSAITDPYNIDCSLLDDSGMIGVGSSEPDQTLAFDPNTPVDNVHGDC
jgi:hypothetical protein